MVLGGRKVAVKIGMEELYRELTRRYSGRQLRLEYGMAAKLYNSLFLWLGVDTLSLSDCSLQDAGQFVRIEGELPSINASLHIPKGRISIETMQETEDTLSYRALLSVPGNVELADFLCSPAPFLPGGGKPEESLFAGFSMTNLTLSYGSELTDVSLKGLAGRKKSDTRWDSYAWLLADVMPAEGVLAPYRFDYTQLKLNLQAGQSVSLPIGEGTGMLVLDTEENRRAEGPQMVSRAYMQWEIAVKGQDRAVTFYTGLFGGAQDVWQYSAVSNPPLAVPDIMEMLGGLLSLPAQQIFLPQGAFFSSFGLKRLDLVYQRRDGGNTFDSILPRYTRGIFSLDGPLEIFLPNLTLERLDAVWEASRPQGAKPSATLFLAAGAALGLGKLKLYGEVSAYIPQMQFQGRLILQGDETLQGIAAQSGIRLPGFWQGANAITSMEIEGNAIMRSLRLSMDVCDALSLPVTDTLLFQLENIHAFLDYSGGEKGVGISGRLAFSYEQGGSRQKFAFSVSALYEKEEWMLSGGLAYGTVDLGALIQAVLGREVTDTAAAGVRLQDFLVSYAVEKREFCLFASCELWFDILGIRPTAGARLRLRLCGEEKEAALAVYLQLGIFTALAQVDNVYRKDKAYLFRIGLMDKYLEAVYKKEQSRHSLRVSLGNTTLGDIVLGLIRLVNPNARNYLPPPWDVLDRIKLSDFLFRIDWDGERTTAFFLYQVNRSIAGLVDIEQIGVSYEDGQIRYIVTGSCLGQKYTPEEPLSWDAQNGSPADNAATDGQKFHIAYLGIGSRLELEAEGDSIQDMVANIRRALAPCSGIPDFSCRKQGGWLIASDFSYQDLFHIWLLLYDPEIYGAAIRIDVPDKSPLAVFQGLFLELFYKKISDETGMFHCRLTLPKQYSEIDLGAVRFYLGEILVEVYTDGSFYLDLGFPHNGDFSRSWGMAFGIYMGKGGIYFGVFHGDAVQSVPEITNGAFSPVVKIGIGLSVGLSRSFDLGIARGGVSLTAFGMFEGVFAVFQPKDTGARQGFYYKVYAMAGVSGTVFLDVDFKIIAVSASAQITAFCEMTLESYRRALLAVDLELELNAYIKILFIKISFSFHFHQRAEFSFGSEESTPWQLKNPSGSAEEIPVPAEGRENLTAERPAPAGGKVSLAAEKSAPAGRETGAGENGNRSGLTNVCLHPDSAQGRISITAVLLPFCSLTEGGDYCMAFPLFISEEDMASLADLLFRILCPEGMERMGRQYLCALQEALRAEIIDYAFVRQLFAEHIRVHVRMSKESVDEDGCSEAGGILFPMLPELILQVNETVICYDEKMAGEDDFRKLAEYYAWLNANPSYELPQEIMRARNGQEKVPLCGVILTDWVRLAAEQLTGKTAELFRGLDAECGTLAEALEDYGIAAEALLAGNPDMSLVVASVPKLVIQTRPGDTLNDLALRYGLAPEQLWQGIAHRGGLFAENPGAAAAGLFGMGDALDHARAGEAAMYAARFSEGEVYFSSYAEQILKDNPHIDLQWECQRYGETAVKMPDGSVRRAFAGDTVVRLAKEAAVLGKLRPYAGGEESRTGGRKQPYAWEAESQTEGKEQPYAWEAESRTERRKQPYTWEAESRTEEKVQGMLRESMLSLGRNLDKILDTGTAASVFRRLYPYFNGRPWEFPLWETACLRPGCRIELENVQTEEGRQRADAGYFAERFGMEALAGCIYGGTASLDGRQTLHIAEPREIPVHVLRSRLTGNTSVKEIGAVISRAFLQGTRIFEPQSGLPANTDTGLKPLYEVLRQQFPLPCPVTDCRLRLGARPDAAWIAVDTELLEIPAGLITSWLPEEKTEALGGIAQIPDFDYRPKCWTGVSGWEIAGGGDMRQYLGMLPDSMYGYLGRHSCALRLEKEGAGVDPLWWGSVLNVRLYRKEKGIYAVAGVRGDETELLYTLLGAEGLSGFFFYFPDRLQSGQKMLLPALGGVCRLIQTKLSTVTHSVFGTASLGNRETGRSDFLADLTDMPAFLRLLWESTVTGENLWMYGEQDFVPEDHFNEEGYGELILAVRFDGQACGDAVRAVCLREEPGGIIFYGDEERDKVPLLPSGCAGFTLDRPYKPDNRFQMLFQILGYTAESEYGEKRAYESRPILPSMSGEAGGGMESGTGGAADGGTDGAADRGTGSTADRAADNGTVSTADTGQMGYQFVFPAWKMYGPSRYGAVGKRSVLSLMLRDVLGNQTACGSCLAEGKYNDLLIGLHELPDTKVTYGFGRGEAGAVKIFVTCGAVGEPAAGRDSGPVKDAVAGGKPEAVGDSVAASDLAGDVRGMKTAKCGFLLSALDQFSQDDLRVYAECTLSDCRSILPGSVKGQICEYVEMLYRWECGESRDAPSVMFEVDIQVKREEIILLRFDLYLQRGAGGTENDPALAAKMTVMPLEPEEAFHTGFAQSVKGYRLAYDTQGQPYAVGDCVVDNFRIAPYAVPLSGATVRCPEYYALKPLSVSLLTKEIRIPDRDGGYGAAQFVDADVNQWEKQFLSDIEQALDVGLACRASAVCPETVSRLVGSKKKLAGQLSYRICPVRDGGAAVSETVRDMVRERFLDNLTSAYGTGVICAYRSGWKQERKYRLEPEIQDGKGILASKPESEGTDGSGVFCLFLPETAGSPEQLSIRFPYLEYHIREGIGGYERSDWLQLVEPVTGQTDLTAQIPVPFPKKECPLPPQMTGQRNGTDGEELLHYYYEGTVAAQVYNQDMLEVRFCYEELPAQTNVWEDPIDVLAHYQLERDSILGMLGADGTQEEGYQKLAAYAEYYTDERLRCCPEDAGRAVGAGTGGSITLKLGFAVDGEETVLKVLNRQEVDRQLKETGAALSLPDKVQRDGNGWVSIPMALKSLPIYLCSRMQVKSRLIRNENLFGDCGAEVSGEFVFRTEETGLAPLEICADYATPYVLSGMTVETAVTELFGLLQISNYGLAVNAAVFYEYPAVMHPGGVNVRIPVTIFWDARTPQEIADNLNDWIAGNRAGQRAGGKFILDVRVYKEGGRQTVVHGCFLIG